MLTREEKEAIIGMIEDEMQMDDWDAYPQEMQQALESALNKLKKSL